MNDHRKFFGRCVEQAQILSDDPVTRNGAVLVSAVLSAGANRFIRPPLPGWIDRVRTDREFKYAVMQHAEADAIVSSYVLPNETGPVRGRELYCLFATCPTCARLIVRAGVSKVHTLSDAALGGIPARWRKDVDAGRQVLSDCGVEVHFHEDLALGEGFLFDGRVVYV